MKKQKTISAVEARVHFGEVMKRSFKNGECFIVEKSGIPMVAIVNALEFGRLLEGSESRARILERFKAGLPALPEEEVRSDVRRAVRAVRRRARA
jgi:hypothetical protein